MSLYDIYASILTEQIVRNFLLTGTAPTEGQIADALDAITVTQDLTQPLFLSNNDKVSWKEVSSAAKWNNSNAAIRQDLDVLYKELFEVSDQGLQNFDRWKTEAAILEKKLDVLQDRLTNLLLISGDTAGYFNFMQDNFTDTSKVDLQNTTAYVNTKQDIVTIGTSNVGATRVDTSALLDTDVTYTVVSKNNLVSTEEVNQSRAIYAVSPKNNFWQVRIKMKPATITTIQVDINLKKKTTISRIDLHLHQANANSSTQVTPLLSTDNYNFTQLATTNYSQYLVDKGTFLFPPIETQYIRLLMTKRGQDTIEQGTGNYVYEFGADEISFYNEGFAPNSEVVLISQPLSITQSDGTPMPFSKAVLSVCEYIPDKTSIDYYLAAGVETTAVSGLNFVSIDPLSRTKTTRPTLIDFGDINVVTTSGISISYHTGTTSGIFLSPSQSFDYVSESSGNYAVVTSGQTSSVRYAFQNQEDKILSHVISSGLNIADKSLELWRNVSKQGYDDTNTVRQVRAGWGYSAPYYSTTIYVGNQQGVNVDFGTNPAMMDGGSVKGRTTISAGRHVIQIHEKNWQAIDITQVANLATLKVADPLYPYNHRYIIEGYPYNTTWTEEKVYMGFDIVAQYFMKEVSTFDMLHNVGKDGYQYFARDYQADVSGMEKTTVFLVKSNPAMADFINEDFLLKFKSVNSRINESNVISSQVNYVVLKAVLNTTDKTVTPYIDAYQIKISN